jgi:hypothetical protein
VTSSRLPLVSSLQPLGHFVVEVPDFRRRVGGGDPFSDDMSGGGHPIVVDAGLVVSVRTTVPSDGRDGGIGCGTMPSAKHRFMT